MNYVQFGVYYENDTLGLVRTVCRVIDFHTNASSIAFVKVGKGGYASEVFSMSEDEFKSSFNGIKGRSGENL